MEKGGVKSVAVALLVVSLVAANSATASFEECYAECFVICAVTPNVPMSDCPFKCLKHCIFASASLPMEYDNQSFCKLGCAASSCTKFSSKQNPAEKKVGSCVDSCSEKCTKT